ncbi:A24 family peptidase [Methylophilus sp. 5]|uniref:prepilin peptidase n=1 Tax=Methylophilus sp. 5 TaxID=1112274 RepID=UPI00048C3506|nr:A24 family peptidase [Methylophilus sp. 5]
MTIAEMIVVAWCLSVSLADLYARRIPNYLTLGACLMATGWLLLTGHAMLGAHWQSVAIGVLASLLLTVPAYTARMLGAGDVKLLLAMALLGGWLATLLAFVIAAILALILGAAYMLFIRLSARPAKSGRWLPFGAALSAGLLCGLRITP